MDPREEDALEAPDLNPTVIFNLPTFLILGGFSVMMGMAASVRVGTFGAFLLTLLTFYVLIRLYRYATIRFPPGYWYDKIQWLGTKFRYYPGRPKAYPPLLGDRERR